MSRSKHQRHPVSRTHKCPRAVLGFKMKNGYKELIYRRLKLKPYGKKYFIGYGEETYYKQFGYYDAPQTCKKMERRLAKEYIKHEINEP